MFSYNIFEWILFFYIYCVFGWIFESTYVSLKSKKFVNRGFMKGPMIPIYGEGAIMMVIATTPVRGNIILEFILGMLGATLLEYIVGALMESIFKVKYWDYSNQRFHIKGYICLSSTICWGFLSVLLAEVIHRQIERIVLSLDSTFLIVFVTGITLIFIVDVSISAKEAWNLRVVLTALTKAKEEIALIQHHIEIRTELLAEQLSDKKEEFVEDLQERKEIFLQSLKENWGNAMEPESLKNKLEEEWVKYQSLIEKFSYSSRLILKRNPGTTSKKFYEALENVKEYIEIKRKNK